jgi:hypothetical protein
MEIRTSSTKAGDRSITIEYPLADGEGALAANVAAFGEEVVLSAFLDQIVIKFQARVRGLLEKGSESKPNTTYMTDEEIIAAALDWKPGVTTVRKGDPISKLLAKTDDMSAEDIERLFNKLLDKKAALAAAANAENDQEEYVEE